jgi:S1-C subfamily serine protease
MDKLFFTKTKENINSGKSSFKVTMGIMPDYTFNGNGVMVDGVSDNRPAQKAGVQIGDIIYQLGNTIVSDVQSYMEALSKFKKGDAVNVKIKRGNDEIVLNVVF